MPTLTDTRCQTIDDARQILEQLAHCDCRLASEQTRTERRIAQIKSECELRTAQDRQNRCLLEAKLTAFILSNQDLFNKPRAVRTEFGEFGLRSVTDRLDIADEAAVIAWARENGYDDVLQTVVTVVRDAVKKRIKVGEPVPGCTIPQGERAYYKVAKALLDEAVADNR